MSEPPSADLVLRRVKKQYAPGQWAVQEIDLSVFRGEFFSLLGPSGCGKTTTLRMVAGLETVTSGEIVLRGARINDLPPQKRDVAMVFQDYALYPNYSVFDNIAFNLRLRKTPQAEIDRRVRRLTDLMGIGHLLKRMPRQLSGGERQRVALGRALVREPKVFLLDEPLSNLDLKLREQMRIELHRVHRELGTTTLFVTHDQGEALTLSDRLAVFDKGQVLQIGTPREIYDRPAHLFVARFVGSPSINLYRASLRADGEVTLGPEGREPLSYRLEGSVADRFGRYGVREDVVAGFRAEHLVIGTEASPGAVPARVEMLEYAGAQSFAVVAGADLDEASLDGARTMAAAPQDAALAVGQPVWLSPQWSKAVIFDRASGKNLDYAKSDDNGARR